MLPCVASPPFLDQLTRLARTTWSHIQRNFVDTLHYSLESFHSTSTFSLIDLVRKYSDAAGDILEHLPSNATLVNDAEGKAALIWTIGEYGERLPEAPYLLEDYINAVADEEAAVVRLQLLTAAVKLFFKRPPECQNMLGRLLQHCIDEDVDMDVHDRAVLYYRLLKCSTSEAKRVVAGPKPPINLFTEDRVVDSKDKLLSEFNTLSVVYGQLSATFIPQVPPYTLAQAELDLSADDRFERAFTESTASVTGSSVEDRSGVDLLPSNLPLTSSIPIGVTSVPAVGDLLGEFGLAPEESPPLINLNSNPKMSPADFERQWTSLPQSESVELHLSVVPSPEELEQTMSDFHIVTMASSPPGQPIMKFFFYSQQIETGTFFFTEATVMAEKAVMSAVFKCADAGALGPYKEHFRKSLVGKWIPLEL
eukprot:m.162889 g.162889  ORF g.162889 m.162889 type:complete len:423 (+) comp38848_c0_seq3:2974-4242(+)